MHLRALLVAADVDVAAAPMLAAASYSRVAAVAAAALRPPASSTEIRPGPGLFAETLRVAQEVASPRQRSAPAWVIFDFGPSVVDGEHRLAGFRAVATIIAERAVSWATMTTRVFEWLRDGVHKLLGALVGLLRTVGTNAGVDGLRPIRASEHRLRSLSNAPGAPPVADRLHPLEGPAAAA